MFRLLFVVLSLAVPTAAHAYTADDEFDARLLTYDEKRLVQATLIVSRDYNGLLDGAWGKGSQRALEAFVMRTHGDAYPRWRHVRPLVREWDRRYKEQIWEPLDFASAGVSVHFPSDLLRPVADDSDITFRSVDDGLVFRVIFSDRAKAVAMHDWLAAAHVGPRAFYRATPRRRVVSAGEIPSGERIYLSTSVSRGVHVTLLVQSTRTYEIEAALMEASMRFGSQGRLVASATGPLSARSEMPPESIAAPPPAETAPERSPGSSPQGSGTGFFVNDTDVVTAAHVIDGCRNVTLEDGSPLLHVGKDDDLDVAVLSARRRSDTWLTLTASDLPPLGSDVIALGYPYLAVMRDHFDQGLAVTGGNIGSLPRRARDAGARIMITAPVQPGNSGGPLLNRNGEVVGIVVSRVNDFAILEGTGTLPQNINFATPIANVVAFLEAHYVILPTGAPARSLSDGSVPAEIGAAVVPVLCYQH